MLPVVAPSKPILVLSFLFVLVSSSASAAAFEEDFGRFAGFAGLSAPSPYSLMAALVNLGGGGDIYTRGSILSDSTFLLSVAPSIDVYCSPRKRSRVTAPLVLKVRAAEVAEQKQHQTLSINTLPDECVFEILRRLPGDKERSVSACVSKRWLMLLSSIRPSEISVQKKPAQTLMSDQNEGSDGDLQQECNSNGYLTRRLNVEEATDNRLSAIAVGTCSRGGLGKLFIQGSNTSRGVSDLGLSAIARGCPSLKVLSIWKVPLITDHGLSEIANGCPLLEKIDLCQCPSISDKGLMAIAKKCPNLASLTIESCSSIGNEGLQAIGHCCPKLKYLSIKACQQVGDKGLASLVSSASASLEKIKLQMLSISDMSLAVIGYYGKNIIDLAFSGLLNVTEKGFWVMGNTLGLEKLKSISITSCNGVTDLGLQAIAKGSPNLKVLCLQKSCNLSDAGLKAFAEAAKGLENLQLEECHRVSLISVISILSSNLKLKMLTLVKCLGIWDISFYPSTLPICYSLRSLTIHECPGLTNVGVALLGKICPQLQNIDLSGQSGVTDDSLLPLVKGSEIGLLKVNLSNCVNLTDLFVAELVKTHGSTLELLNVGGCKKITDKSLLAMAENSQRLDELDLSRCSVSDYGVAILASARQLNLRILSFLGCSQLTGKSLPLLGNMGRSVVGLNLQGCSLIGSHEIDLLEEKMWWCDILS